MKPYSVLLLYPDYIADTFGECYYDFVEAKNAKSAVKKARQNCASVHDFDKPEDLLPLLVIEGHHMGLAT